MPVSPCLAAAPYTIYIPFWTGLDQNGRPFVLELALMAYEPRSPSDLPGLRVRNTRTQALIRRDTIWQIGVPLGIALLIVLVLMALIALPLGAPVRSVWADISLIFLIIPTALTGLVLLAVLAGAIYGLNYLLRELPFFAKPVQDWMVLLSYRVSNVTERVANVFLSTRSFWAGVRRAAKDARSLVSVRRSP
jgi:hypothetical protein